MAYKILVVDDDSGIRDMLGIILEARGFEVEYSEDGSGAFAIFSATKPDLVLLDVMLPGKDGVEVCKEIRAISGVPVIMLTAKTDDEDVVAGLEAGADDYIFKPMPSFKVLQARIEARLRPMREPEVGEEPGQVLGQAR